MDWNKAIEKELVSHILPFWMNMMDDTYGGFYGEMSEALVLNKEAPKGGLAITRMLWTFSSAYRVLKEEKYLDYARHAYTFLSEKMIDQEHGGVYWMANYKGEVIDDRKHIYNQAFGIYACSEYYRVSHDETALETAISLYNLVCGVGYDEEQEAYLEEFSRTWLPLSNEKLSENGVMASLTYNTHLHILEAYTNLYRVWPKAELKQRIVRLLTIFRTNIYDENTTYYRVFFNAQWESILDMKSFGHDIESSWLVYEALKVIGEESNSKWMEMVIKPAYSILKSDLNDDGSLIYEEVEGKVNRKKVWWVQAEAMVGFYNAYELTKSEPFLVAAKKVWTYTEKNIIDQREGGEWLAELDENHCSVKAPVVEPWKLAYHNTRCCLEMMVRISKV